MSKHTPGPHTVEYAPHLGDPAYAIRAGDGDLIAVGLVKGDADLFAAAPDLLAALRDVIAASNHDGEYEYVGDCKLCQVVKQARAAIAKAGA